MQDKWRKAEHCTERADTSTAWMEKTEHARQMEHCTERAETSTAWMEKTEHARQVEESGALY